MSLVTLEAGSSAVVESDPAGSADQLSALLYRGQENSRRARALMEVIRPAARDLPLPAATNGVQHVIQVHFNTQSRSTEAG